MALLPFYQRVLKADKPLKRRALRLSKGYPENPSTFGDRLRKWRIDAGLTQPEVCKKLGVKRSTYNHWESRKFVPGRRNWSKIASVTGIEEAVLSQVVPRLSERAP